MTTATPNENTDPTGGTPPSGDGSATNPPAAGTTPEGGTVPPEGQGQGEGKTGEGETPKPVTGAPESYEAFTLPEGYALEGPRLESVHSLFKELALPQAAAQKLIDAYVNADGENATAFTELAKQKRVERIEQWGKDSETLLGDGYKQTVDEAKASYNALRLENPKLYAEVEQAFGATEDGEGWGNHPAMIQLMAFYGRKLGGSPLKGMGGNTTDNSTPRPVEARLWPDAKQ